MPTAAKGLAAAASAMTPKMFSITRSKPRCGSEKVRQRARIARSAFIRHASTLVPPRSTPTTYGSTSCSPRPRHLRDSFNFEARLYPVSGTDANSARFKVDRHSLFFLPSEGNEVVSCFLAGFSSCVTAELWTAFNSFKMKSLVRGEWPETKCRQSLHFAKKLLSCTHDPVYFLFRGKQRFHLVILVYNPIIFASRPVWQASLRLDLCCLNSFIRAICGHAP